MQLKVKFLSQGEYHSDVMRDLFGDGIFAVDGDKWRHQRKLASYEFSAKVLRDFSTSVFRVNAAKLASKVLTVAAAEQIIDLQVCLVYTEEICIQIIHATRTHSNVPYKSFLFKVNLKRIFVICFPHKWSNSSGRIC